MVQNSQLKTKYTAECPWPWLMQLKLTVALTWTELSSSLHHALFFHQFYGLQCIILAMGTGSLLNAGWRFTKDCSMIERAFCVRRARRASVRFWIEGQCFQCKGDRVDYTSVYSALGLDWLQVKICSLVLSRISFWPQDLPGGRTEIL